MFPIIRVSGPPSARGEAYGREARVRIKQCVANYARRFAYRLGVDWSEVRLLAVPFAQSISELTPLLHDELAGVARGAEMELIDLVAVNARTEILGLAPEMVASQSITGALDRNVHLIRKPPTECTSIIATPPATAPGEVLFAQTWDWNGEQRDTAVLLVLDSDAEPAIITLTEAGMLGKIGLNSAGLCVGLNILASLDDGRSRGLPIHVLLRRLLQCASTAEAYDLIQTYRSLIS